MSALDLVSSGRPATDAATLLRTARRRSATRDGILLGVLALAVIALFLVALVFGTKTIPLLDVLRALGGETVPGASFAVVELRLPRAIGALLVGAAFGLGGMLFQTLLRNVLASPDVIGISAGSSAAAITAISFFGASGLVVSVAAIAGGVLTALLIWVLAYRRGLSGLRFVLVGIAVAAALQAVISYVLTRSDINAAEQATVWMAGSLSRSLWDQLGPTAPVLVVLLVVALLAATRLPVLRLGDDSATALGARPQRVRMLLILCAVLLVAVATSLTGPIAFVAFLAGPIALRVVRRDSALPAAAALVGAIVVLGGDAVAQHAFPTDLPVGVVTGAIGAPFLLYLLMRGRTRA
ncbi:iron chelate uptake ABC transporter family permease subunit [Microbacterium sp. KUDC0406]|uniref:FecCD family ABC transporter permease n=1 Tax=Microbacterium sp. KUDC0406 TaxID=2909588 RepID=UPI001F276DD5|nr:iron chelate uptake ABC transporter family permease subunit [Microbacterium sp. KUDC0406]UJP10712.1 iron chelate uptake ABC transporter family permease subunit [Microbacterium sp. KUDC0406]